jgi:hypothetical protein
MRTTLATILVLAIGAGALAQPVTPRTTGHPATSAGQPPSVDFTSLFELGEDGTPKALTGSADIAALANNTLITTETRDALKPAIAQWFSKIERLATENIDLLVRLDTSAFENFDLKDVDNLLFINDSVTMLSSAGSLTDFLLLHAKINDQQAQQNRRIVNDFQRSMIMYNAQKAQDANPENMDAQLQVAMTANYRESLRDVFWIYSRIIDSLAGHPGDVAKSLDAQAGSVQAELDALEGAEDQAQRIDAVRMLLAKLEYDRQRELAELALRLNPTSVARDD